MVSESPFPTVVVITDDPVVWASLERMIVDLKARPYRLPKDDYRLAVARCLLSAGAGERPAGVIIDFMASLASPVQAGRLLRAQGVPVFFLVPSERDGSRIRDDLGQRTRDSMITRWRNLTERLRLHFRELLPAEEVEQDAKEPKEKPAPVYSSSSRR